MEDVAEAIDGTNPGHYGLRLDRFPVPANSDRVRTLIGQGSDRDRTGGGQGRSEASGTRLPSCGPEESRTLVQEFDCAAQVRCTQVRVQAGRQFGV